MKNAIIEKFGQQKRWVNWRLEKVGENMTKVPYAIDGKKASSVDYSTWSTYAEAKKASDKVGIMFGKKKTLLGIDIDKITKDGEIVHEDREKILTFITEAQTYCELSPSGTGLHLFLEIDAPLDLKVNRRGPYEAYTTGRYFTFTGTPFGIEQDVRTVSADEAQRLLSIILPPPAAKPQSTPKPSLTADLSDTDLLEKMFASKNGGEIQRLYNGDISKYKDDDSIADLALCSHLAFWTRRNVTQIERIWLSSPLGAREKTVTRKDYRDRTINTAVASCTEVYSGETVKKVEKIKELDLLFKIGAKGAITIIQCVENIVRVLHGHREFAGMLKFDQFKNVLFYGDKPLEEHTVLDIQTRIQVLFPEFSKVTKDMVYDAMMKVSHDNAFDSAKDYILALKWDGVARVDSWISKTYNTPNDPYHTSVGANWLKGLVKRIMEPGCKFDHVLVLEGEQGIKKSTSLTVLGRDWHVETAMSTENKDFFMMFQGKAIIEFSEGETLNRTEVKRMKAIITTQSDKYRPAYARLSVDFPRRCVFAMTTNAEEYLKDETGNRRWLPVKCEGVANVEWLEENRDQLFAEAYQRVVVKKETTWEFDDELMKEAQDLRRIHDPWEETIIEWYDGLQSRDKDMGISIGEVFEKAIHKGSSFGKPIARFEEMSISDVLKRVLKLDKRRSVLGGVRTYRYYPVGAPVITMEVEKAREVPKTNLDLFVDALKDNKEF